MSYKKILHEIKENLDVFLKKDKPLAKALWVKFLNLDSADICHVVKGLDEDSAKKVVASIPRKIRNKIFGTFSLSQQVDCLALLDEHARVAAMRSLDSGHLKNLINYLEKKKLYSKERENILHFLSFKPESAGRIMIKNGFSFSKNFTVDETIKSLKSFDFRKDVHNDLYIVDDENKLLGHIKLGDLFKYSKETVISTFMVENDVVAREYEDREEIAKKMIRHSLTTVPVVDNNDCFLGIIPSWILVDIILKETREDFQIVSALIPMKLAYMKMPFLSVLYRRGIILVSLLLVQSISSYVLGSHEETLPFYLLIFIPMIMSAAGNISNQTSALAIQGMASGEINGRNTTMRFVKREMVIAFALSVVLGLVAFLRVYFTKIKHVDYLSNALMGGFSVALALSLIVIVAVAFSSIVPFALRKLKIDPAFSAGPFLTTLMDLVSVTIFVIVIKMFLFRFA